MLRRASRTLMAGFFIVEGVEAVRRPTPTDDEIPRLPGVAPADVPMVLRANGAAQVLGGGLMVLDRAPRASATLLAASLVPATAAGPERAGGAPVTAAEKRRLLLRNLALFGGLVITAMDTEGRPGIGWRAGHLVDVAGKEAEWRRREAELLAQIARYRAHNVATEARAKTIVPAKRAAKDAKLALRAARKVGKGANRTLDAVTSGTAAVLSGVGTVAGGAARGAGRAAVGAGKGVAALVH